MSFGIIDGRVTIYPRPDIARSEDRTGVDCTGSSGETNRQLVLQQTTIQQQGVVVIVNGTVLHQGTGKDYTLSGNVITFLNPIWNEDNIRVIYFV